MKLIYLILRNILILFSITVNASVQDSINKSITGKNTAAWIYSVKTKSHNVIRPFPADNKNIATHSITFNGYSRNLDRNGLMTHETVYVDGMVNMR